MATNHHQKSDASGLNQDMMAQNAHHHIVSFEILRNVALALLVLTALTVILAKVNLGILAAPVAFLIAFLKAMMVIFYFMGLKYDTKLNRIVFFSGFAFLALLLFFAALDIGTRILEKSPL